MMTTALICEYSAFAADLVGALAPAFRGLAAALEAADERRRP